MACNTQITIKACGSLDGKRVIEKKNKATVTLSGLLHKYVQTSQYKILLTVINSVNQVTNVM